MRNKSSKIQFNKNNKTSIMKESDLLHAPPSMIIPFELDKYHNLPQIIMKKTKS